jgi:hypothetical protein
MEPETPASRELGEKRVGEQACPDSSGRNGGSNPADTDPHAPDPHGLTAVATLKRRRLRG